MHTHSHTPASLQGTVREVYEPSRYEDIRAAIKQVSPQIAPGLSGLCFSHLPDTLTEELVKGFAKFAKLVFSSTCIHNFFLALRMATNMSALGVEAR